MEETKEMEEVGEVREGLRVRGLEVGRRDTCFSLRPRQIHFLTTIKSSTSLNSLCHYCHVSKGKK